MNRLLCIGAAALALCGCATTSDVVKTGKDSYMVGVQVRGEMTSWSEVKAKSMQQATAFCQKLGKEIVLDHVQTNGVRGWTPQESEIYFQCLSADDPAYSSVKMRRDPDVVIEERKQQ